MSSTDSPIPAPRPSTALPAELWFEDLKAAAQTSWLWHGYVAPGNLTLLTSQWKSGKTTLSAVLLARLKGGGQLADLAVRPAKALVVSEEAPAHWARRAEKLDLAGHVCWFCRPFPTKPSAEQWLALLDRIGELHRRHGLGLVVIDPLAAFLPGRDENSAASMLEALLPLQRLTAEGLAVLVLHHPRKGETRPGQAARGSGALAGCADIVIEMNWYGRVPDGDRRRKLRAWSRHDETPRELVIELTENGTDYLALGDIESEAYGAGWQVVWHLLESAGEELTRRELLEQWPADVPVPGETTLWQWLERGVSEGRLVRWGSGRKKDPFRYRLANQPWPGAGGMPWGEPARSEGVENRRAVGGSSRE